MTRSIAIIYAPQGGFGDVGKYAIAHALKAKEVNVKPIVMTSKSTAEAKFDFEVDVQPQSLQDELKAVFDGISTTQVVLEDAGAQGQLDEQLADVDAVIACLGSRQPGNTRPELKSHWCHAGAEMVTHAMHTAGVQRLVLLSSFGLYDDFTPFGPVKVLWRVLMATILRHAIKDLYAMEDHVSASDLDYVLVRTAGLTPSAAPAGEWKVLTAGGQGKLGVSISKSDVAAFMVQEALQPQFHRRPVTIGGKM